ncbi:hypothetical protein BU15DRAFT_61539 [Melanogaster broomeanus]|nr:hypothetical protein BU15DRAFT_61539 [Melanogaster broomeanus]
MAGVLSPTSLSKLERAWGIGHHKLNVDTRYNLMCLRADWHTLFDRSQWVLVPESDVLRQLAEIYVMDEVKSYNLKMVHFPPYNALGTLTSHIHPHFIICNIQKLSPDELDVVSGHLNDGRIFMTSLLYEAWTRDEPGPSRPSSHSDPPAQEGQGDFSPAAGDSPPGAGPSARSPSSDRSHGDSSHAEASQGQMRAAEHIEGSDYSADSAVVEHGWDNSEDATWIKDIYHWRKEGRAASEGGWDPIVVNDGQLSTILYTGFGLACSSLYPGKEEAAKHAKLGQGVQDPNGGTFYRKGCGYTGASKWRVEKLVPGIAHVRSTSKRSATFTVVKSSHALEVVVVEDPALEHSTAHSLLVHLPPPRPVILGLLDLHVVPLNERIMSTTSFFLALSSTRIAGERRLKETLGIGILCESSNNASERKTADSRISEVTAGFNIWPERFNHVEESTDTSNLTFARSYLRSSAVSYLEESVASDSTSGASLLHHLTDALETRVNLLSKWHQHTLADDLHREQMQSELGLWVTRDPKRQSYTFWQC